VAHAYTPIMDFEITVLAAFNRTVHPGHPATLHQHLRKMRVQGTSDYRLEFLVFKSGYMAACEDKQQKGF